MIDLGASMKKRVRSVGRTPARVSPGLAMHSAASADWGTPMLLRSFALEVLRAASTTGSAIDLDYATSAYWQSWWPSGEHPHRYLDGSPGRDVRVEADREAACPGRGTGFLNAPGLDGGEMVQECWALFEKDHREGKLGSGVWIGFSLEQFASLQSCGERNPLSVGEDAGITTIVPSRRSRYVLHPEQAIVIMRKRQAKHARRSKLWLAEQRRIEKLENRTDDAPVPGNAPSHASYITILWSAIRTVRRKQMAAARKFLAEQRKDEKSLLYRLQALGPLDV